MTQRETLHPIVSVFIKKHPANFIPPIQHLTCNSAGQSPSNARPATHGMCWFSAFIILSGKEYQIPITLQATKNPVLSNPSANDFKPLLSVF